jgi:hypothetical protein
MQYDAKHENVIFNKGDILLKFDKRKADRIGEKLNPTNSGQYKIVEIGPNRTFQLSNDNGKDLQSSNVGILFRIINESKFYSKSCSTIASSSRVQ